MYDTEHIVELLKKESSLSALYAMENLNIAPVTVRTKGQLLTERFQYIANGTQIFTPDNGKEVISNKGDIVYLPPDITYVSKWEDAPNSAAFLILFSTADNSVIADNIFVIAKDKYGTYYERFKRLAEIFEKGRLGYKIQARAVFWEIYHDILTNALSKDKDNTSISNGILYIENNYMNHLNIDEIAKMCFISPATFRRKFKTIMGMSPIEYKNMLKIKKASELLKTGEFSVTEAAKEVNMADIYYFSKMFKKYMGINAVDYIKKNKKL